jgi:hypothetical protein
MLYQVVQLILDTKLSVVAFKRYKHIEICKFVQLKKICKLIVQF